ncbi:hypothetical protein SAMN02745165_02433 [Malonomonas rubra DSM 5091]|uniref:Uncharacterized protein n=1 Tax=Malonomonas rubra DSM 5091 TaxID=1122189 RepID=A0A1M6JFU3_MALRU|nr:hypothetical protein [Malonomonas rubra]SHJ45547.1 hypothetical protein SAMN02745165_02433 [Malonomonas rubra DSM 5091]
MAEKTDDLKMCQLKAQGLMEEIDRRSDKPEFVCGKCRAKANRAEDLHNPRPLGKNKLDSFWS